MAAYLALDPQGNAYILGETELNVNTRKVDLFLAKVDPQGRGEWVRVFGGSEMEMAEDLEFANGHAYILALTFKKVYLYGQSWDCPDIVVGKFDPFGNPVWIYYLDTGYCEWAYDIVVVGKDIYIVGTTWYGSWEEFIAKVTDRGGMMEFRWFRIWDSDRYEDELTTVSTDGTYLYCAGALGKEGTDKADMHLLKVDLEGNVVWSYVWDSGQTDYPYRSTYSGAFYVAGSVGPGEKEYPLLLTVDQYGRMGFALRGNMEGRFLGLTYDGTVVAAGVVGEDGLIARISSSGDLVWAMKWAAPDWNFLSAPRKSGGSVRVAGYTEGGRGDLQNINMRISKLGTKLKPISMEFEDVTPQIGTPNFLFKERGFSFMKTPSKDGDGILLNLKLPNSPEELTSLAALGFPGSFSYYARQADISLCGDALSGFAGRSVKEANFTVLLGGIEVFPTFQWEKYGARFERVGNYYTILAFKGEEYRARWAREDYALLIYDPVDVVVRVAGITRYGTKAGLLWLLSNFSALNEERAILVKWVDLNGNGDVDPGEITRI